ncbi:hypothetical protein B5F40_10725 [Gordonibacter sp. An230]|nr:hypothetical protein B5F40_10725 [Gordonibacter sp. An230]
MRALLLKKKRRGRRPSAVGWGRRFDAPADGVWEERVTLRALRKAREGTRAVSRSSAGFALLEAS